MDLQVTKAKKVNEKEKLSDLFQKEDVHIEFIIPNKFNGANEEMQGLKFSIFSHFHKKDHFGWQHVRYS